jgi:hypothetical protein
MSSSAFKKLPPGVTRELMRHVSRKPLPKPSDAAEQLKQQQGASLQRILYACVAFTATAASIPLVAHWWMGGLVEKEEGLTPAQVRRGAFQNSGTTDIGRDPNWDFTKGEYTKDAGYWSIFQEEKAKRLPGEFHAMPSENLKKHEEQLKQFAIGKVKQNGKPTDYK